MTEFAGMTRELCCSACSEKGCVVAGGRPFCFHPCKGGAPKSLAEDPQIQMLQAEARKALGMNTQPLQGAA
jgi:hypothetical protein